MFSNLNRLQLSILVLIIASAILTGVLAFVSAKTTASDRQKIMDVTKIAEALKIYFDVNGFYPAANAGMPDEIEMYLDFYPTPPKSSDNCENSAYKYDQRPGGEDYTLRYCLNGQDYTWTSKDIQE